MELPLPGQSLTQVIPGPAGHIEVQLAAPPGEARGYAVICHPHPLFGGAMSNKVVYSLASCALQNGLVALRFNFRGVGRSAGLHDEGRGETDDVLHLMQQLQQRLPEGARVLAGFSFGAFVALRAAAQAQPHALISIAPPFEKYFGTLPRPPRPACPWLVLHSRDDEVVAYEETQRALAQYVPPPELVTVDGAGHFFHGRLQEISAAVNPFLQQHLA